MDRFRNGSKDVNTSDGTFAPTRWSLVKRASVCGEALGSWIGLYWHPLYAWARHRGWTAEDAADEVQCFLEKICRFRLLEQADPSRGRLRSWLLKSFSNHLVSSRKRDGPPGHPLSRAVDRIGFTPLLFPLMVALGRVALVSAMFATVLVSARTWWQRDHRMLSGLVALFAIGTASVFAKPAVALLTAKPTEKLMTRNGPWIDPQMTAHMRSFASFLLGAKLDHQPRGAISH